MNIREFIELTNKRHNDMLRSMPASEVLLRRTTGIDWETEFRQQGFIPIKYPQRTISNDIFVWCKNTFGDHNYVAFYRSTSATYTFWFDNPHNATLFRIRWS